MVEIENLINSLKGISGSGNVLAEAIKLIKDANLTLEPGDFARSDMPAAMTAPIAYDLWYLFAHDNLMAKYYTGIDGDHFDYKPYMDENLKFLELLAGLKPLKVLRDLEQQFQSNQPFYQPFWETLHLEWQNNGVYWINTSAFELWLKDKGMQYASDGPKDFKINDYVGYISFPVGQLGVMEVISLLQETKLSGYAFAGGESPSPSGYKPQLSAVLEDKDKPSLQSTPEMFADMKDSKGNILAGQNYCYGKHLVESAYLVPSNVEPSASRDVELFSSKMEKYLEDVKPKLWMRYWIHKDSTMPVPGEFIGILCRPVTAPPHVWWFQESAPFLYAGNWMETAALTSGVITGVTLEEDRDDDGIGNQYDVLIQGCEVFIDSTDFFTYAVGERVAILKLKSGEVDNLIPATKSFTWLDQPILKDTDKLTELVHYVIAPMTFYKKQ